MRNTKFSLVRMAFVGFSLTIATGASAAKNPQKASDDVIYTKAAFDQNTKTMFLGGKQKVAAGAGKDATLVKSTYNGDTQQWSDVTKLSTGALNTKEIKNITLLGSVPVVSVDDQKVHLVKDAMGTLVSSAAELKDAAGGNTKDIRALANDGAHIFAAVTKNGKTWAAHDGDDRGIAVVAPDDFTKITALTQKDPADLTNDADAVRAIKAAANNAGEGFGKTAGQPLAIKATAGGIAGAELMENVSMAWNGALQRLHVGLEGVKRDNHYLEGGVTNLLTGKIEGTAFTLAPAVGEMGAPSLDVNTAHMKTQIANVACCVERLLAANDADAPLFAVASSIMAAIMQHESFVPYAVAVDIATRAIAGQAVNANGLKGNVQTALKIARLTVADATHTEAAGKGNLADAVKVYTDARDRAKHDKGLAFAAAVATIENAAAVADAGKNTIPGIVQETLAAAGLALPNAVHTAAGEATITTAADVKDAYLTAYKEHIKKIALDVGLEVARVTGKFPSIAPADAGILSTVAAIFSAGWLSTVMNGYQYGTSPAANNNLAMAVSNAIGKVVNAGELANFQKAYAAAAGDTAATNFAAAIAAANDDGKLGGGANGLAKKLDDNTVQFNDAGTFIDLYDVTDETNKLNIGAENALKGALNRIAYLAKTTYVGVPSEMAQTAAVTAGYVMAFHYARTTIPADAGAVATRAKASIEKFKPLTQAMARVLRAHPVAGVEAGHAVQEIINAYAAGTTLNEKKAAIAAIAQEYVDLVGYTEGARAAKKVMALTQKTPDDVHALVAAVAASLLLDTDAIAAKAQLTEGTTNYGIVDAYAAALTAWDLYKAEPTDEHAQALLNAAIAYEAALENNKKAVSHVDKYDDTAAGYTAIQDAAHAQKTAELIKTYASAVQTAQPTLASATLATSTLAQKAHDQASEADVLAVSTALYDEASQYQYMKVAANTNDRIVATYSAPLDQNFVPCNKTAKLDAPDTLNPYKKRIIDVFAHNGNDPLAITMGQMVPMTVGGNQYMIAHVVAHAPGQRAGSLVIPGTRSYIVALPLTSEGNIARMINGVPEYDTAAITMNELPSLHDLSVLVGGHNLVNGAWVRDIMVHEGTVYVVLGGYNAAHMGVVYATPQLNEYNVITGWGTWKRYKPEKTMRRAIAAFFDTNDDLMLVAAEAENRVADVANLNTFYQDINTIHTLSEPAVVALNNDGESLNKALETAIPATDGGLVNIFAFDDTVPGFARGEAAFAVSLGWDKIALIQTAENKYGTLVPVTSFAVNKVNHGGSLAAIAPLTNAAFAGNVATQEGWCFVGGYNGIMAYSQANGAGFTNLKTVGATGGEPFGDNIVARQIAQNNPDFTDIRKMVGKGDMMYVLTADKLLAFKVNARFFKARNPDDLVYGILYQAPIKHAFSDMVFLDDTTIALSGTNGLTVLKLEVGTSVHVVDEASGPVMQTNFIPSSQPGKGELIVLFSNYVKKTAQFKRYRVDTSKTIAKVLDYTEDADVSLNVGFVLNFATNGKIAVINTPEEKVIRVLDLVPNAQTTVLFEDFDQSGLPALDSVSGTLMIPGDKGLVTKS